MIATITQLQRHLNTTAEDPRLWLALTAASAQVERYAGRRFVPRRATLRHMADAPGEIVLVDDLLTLESITTAAGVSLDVAPVESTGWSLHGDALLRGEAVDITGVWGWHDDPAIRWRDSGDTLVTLTDATLTVNDAAGADSAVQTPRFQPGHLLKINDEFMRVLAIEGQALTVERGARGTDTTTHEAGAAIFTYQPPADIVAVTLRWAAWLYRLPDDTGDALPALLDALGPLSRPAV